MGKLVCLDTYRSKRQQNSAQVKNKLMEHLQQAAHYASLLKEEEGTDANKLQWMIEDCAYFVTEPEQENEDLLRL